MAPSTADTLTKRRRIKRACDSCRQRKAKCDGIAGSGLSCSTCISYNVDCTYNRLPKKRGPPIKYVQDLESRLAILERALQELKPETSDSKPADSSPKPSSSSYSTQSREAVASADSLLSSDSSEDEYPGLPLYEQFSALDISRRKRTIGLSSGNKLFESAVRMKAELYDVGPVVPEESWGEDPWEMEDEIAAQLALQRARYNFPDEDLLPKLVDAYFMHQNVYGSLLHRPSFEYNIAEGAHIRDTGFGAVVLAVCSIGAKHVDDERVLLPGCPRRSAGWRWFNQIRISSRPILGKPRLCDIQLYLLASWFLATSTKPQSVWMMNGIAQRMLIDAGAHRRSFYSKTPNARDELWKRAFWSVWCTDRVLSSEFGRPCSFHDDDCDVPEPIDCDDEYWITPNPLNAFIQPPNEPSSVSFLIEYIRLHYIQSSALHTLLSVKGSRTPKMNEFGAREVAANIDSRLNAWRESLPPHMSWDPHRENNKFFHQSALLHLRFYGLQIMVHRPFIDSKTPNSYAFTSLAICTHAARAITHILELQLQRPDPPMLAMFMYAYHAAIVLLLNIWGGRRFQSRPNVAKEMKEVQKCIHVFDLFEDKAHSIKGLRNFLTNLASLDHPRPTDGDTSRKELNELPSLSPSGRFAGDQTALLTPSAVSPSNSLETSWHNSVVGLSVSSAHPPILSDTPVESHADATSAPPDLWLPFDSRNTWMHNFDQVQADSSAQQVGFRDDMLAAWANAPTGLSMTEWEGYLQNMNGQQLDPGF